MFLNFCHPCLRPEVDCSTISTEGYDVKNLISESSKGFLAYSCIKPPINIDLTFICNIQISRVIIWPIVGSQKSSGFQLFAKSTTDPGAPYTLLSTAYLNNNECGVIFYRRDINEMPTSVPNNFLQRYIKICNQQAVNKATNLRLSVVKTENSVPAVGKIEVWGRASHYCGRDVIAEVNALWIEAHSPCNFKTPEVKELLKNTEDDDLSKKSQHPTKSKFSLEIPEDFLDPITCGIMVQPIILPSGKIIDQFTLERHEQNEATWGRLPSDPFTGISFSKTNRPVVATALKLRIDKFLIENSNNDEIKKLPRILGHKRIIREFENKGIHSHEHNKSFDDTEIISKNAKFRADSVVLKVKRDHTLKRRIGNQNNLTKSQHKLPIAIPLEKRFTDLPECKRPKFNENAKLCIKEDTINVKDNYPKNNSSSIDGDLELNIKSVLSGLKRFGMPESCKVSEQTKGCLCCETSILYKLPCEHIVCRKALTSNKILQCQYCNMPYTTSDPKRIHE